MPGPDRPSLPESRGDGILPSDSSDTDRPRTPALRILRKRADFLACARARRAGTPGLLLQGRQRRPGEAEGVRVGFTCSRKVGKAVVRNRARRRLREAARAVLPGVGHEGWDYVLIGRPEATVARPFADLLRDLETAVAMIHRGGR